MIPRLIFQNIENELFHRKLIIVTGSRQVGKTTLLQHLKEKYRPYPQTLGG